MKIIFTLFIFSVLISAEANDSSKKSRPDFLVSGIEINPVKESNKSWIHEFETLPLGSEMDHMKKMKDHRPNQYVSK